MKNILIIDDSSLFREFLTHKLDGFGFSVMQAVNGFDGIMKMRQNPFDLIIMDFYLSRSSSIEVLESKAKNPNIRDTPVIMVSAKVDRNSLVQLSQFGIKKFFTKPLKIDLLVKSLSEILQVKIELDSTPCIIDAHLNDDIIFIEVAQGLNWDKIELLKYRLKELINLHSLPVVRILLIMSGLELSANESLQLSSLISVLLDNAGANSRNIKVLTSSSFIKGFIEKKPAFAAIEVLDNIETAIDGLLGNTGPASEIISALASKASEADSGVNLHFENDKHSGIDITESLKSLGENAVFAVVDDDMVIRAIIKKAFSQSRITIVEFTDGAQLLAEGKPDEYDLIFLDLIMPQIDGFKVLQHLRQNTIETPVIVLSAMSKKETVIKALGFGVKSYIIKPVQPEAVCRKAVEVLRMNF